MNYLCILLILSTNGHLKIFETARCVTHSNQIGKRFIKAQAPYFLTTLRAHGFFTLTVTSIHCGS